MRKFLSIVIPRYKETEKEVFPLLSSINLQAGIDLSDIEVIFTNDGGSIGELDKDFLALFDMDIRQISLEDNRGPGVARQVGLDNARGEYVMFCDADDCLHNAGVLGAMIQEAEKTVVDILSTEWLEELVDANGNFMYKAHQIENTWMHGKFLRRQFLTQNNIRFHDKLRVHEDSYFLCIATSATERRNHMPITSYIWKYHPDSITRRNNASYTYKSIPAFIEACSLAHKEVEKRNPSLMEYKIVQFTLYNYFCLHRPDWQSSENAKYLEESEKSFVKHIAPFWHYWTNAKPETIAAIYNQEREKNFAGCLENETLYAWIERIMMQN